MASFYDDSTKFFIGDSDTIPLLKNYPSDGNIEASFKSLILSASGWRKVFVSSGNEEDASGVIGEADMAIAAHIASVFADFILENPSTADKKEIVLGLDSRPTGTMIADIMCRVFIGKGLTVRAVFIASAPEIMSYAKKIGAFAYISASHNPIGHNGVKFGLGDGGVLAGNVILPLIENLKKACLNPGAGKKARELILACSREKLETAWKNTAVEKNNALEAYTSFSREVISGETDIAKQNAFFDILKEAAVKLEENKKPVSVIADFNGSARGCSIDRSFFESAGIYLSGMNEKPRQIVHRIVPEGDSLSFCAREIEHMHKDGVTEAEKNALLGYVPDCDGDRGNIVYWNSAKETAETLEAQEVFALAVIAELSHLVYLGHIHFSEKGKPFPPVAIAVNDPTSLRIEAIAASFGACVERAEVGEANVVNLARSLREEGYIVRILGEGSNGGNITHPAAVRDPLNTVFALLKMLIIRDTPDRMGLFHLWCSLSDQDARYRDDFTLADIIATLPPFVTTSVFEKNAMLEIHTTDHGMLKRNFQRIFLRDWNAKKTELCGKYGFDSWTAISNNGIKQTDNLSDFALSGKGGLKIQFFDKEKKSMAFIWMRGSGTEAVFRILADARGNDASVEKMLLDWLSRMVLEADGKIG